MCGDKLQIERHELVAHRASDAANSVGAQPQDSTYLARLSREDASPAAWSLADIPSGTSSAMISTRVLSAGIPKGGPTAADAFLGEDCRMRFVVVGAGAIGGVVGARLVEAGQPVVFVARGAHGDAISSGGLHVSSPERSVVIEAEVAPHVGDVGWGNDDVVLVAVKSQDTVPVLDALVATAPPDLPVVCLQNGVNNEREALRRFERVYGATVMCPCVYLEPGRVVAHSAPTTGVIDVGRYPFGVDDTVSAIVAALSSSTFSSIGQREIAKWKWRKLVTNLGNAIEAVCGPPARRGPIGDIVRHEAEAVLHAAGIDCVSDHDDKERRGDHLDVQAVDAQPRPGGSSWQSLARSTGAIETPYLNGEIVMLGRLHGVATPANTALLRHARDLAATKSKPGSIDADDFLASLRESE